MIKNLINHLIIGLIDVVMNVFTFTTLPIYYYIQKPWKRLTLANAIQAVRENPFDPYSPWCRVDNDVPEFATISAQSLDSSLEIAMTINGFDYPIAGVKTLKDNQWSYEWFTYGQVINRVNNVAKGLQLLGLGAGDKVLIYAETRLEWILCAFAIFKSGAVLTTLFPQLGIDGVVKGINQTKVKIVITTSVELQRLRTVLSRTPTIETIVDIDGTDAVDGSVQIYPFNHIENNGNNSVIKLPEKSLNNREDIAVIMYTSGTTGDPKGVVATHGQILAEGKAALCLLKDQLNERHRHSYVAFLPLGHMFEFMAEMMAYGVGLKLGYSSPNTLIEGAPGLARGQPSDVVLLRPTVFPGVPLLLDRMRRGISEQLNNRPVAKALFYRLIKYKNHWRSKGYTTPLINHILCRRARKKFGCDIEYMLVGGAPLSVETERLIALVLNVTVIQAFGGTEVCGASNARDTKDLTFGHTGPPLNGFKIKLVDSHDGVYSVRDKPNPRGEIVISGPSVVNGYYMLEKETNDAFRHENGEKWYYTGDIGQVTPEGCFLIIDRQKYLIKLQNGEYYSLSKIESELKSCPFIENLCVYGMSTFDYLVALVIPNASAIEGLSKQHSSTKGLSFNELCNNNIIESLVMNEIRNYSLVNGLTKREIPAKIKLCADEWTPDNGLLSAAMKVKRHTIIEKYKNEINAMFCNNNDIF